MSGNTFGTIFRLTSFGESHGAFIGGVLDGCPAGLEIDIDFIQAEMNKRRPGFSELTSKRKEDDKVKIISGLFDGKTTGTPIAILIENKDKKSHDYEYLKDTFRPSHGDFSYWSKYGIRDYRGGGRASARETAVRVAAGAIAKLLLKKYHISFKTFISSIYNIQVPLLDYKKISKINEKFPCYDKSCIEKMTKAIEKAKKEGDSLGGTVGCYIGGVMPGLGEPIFDKYSSLLAHAILSIPGCNGFETGMGFEATKMKGSQYNDEFTLKGKNIITKTNNSGGIQAGISNGMPVFFRASFRPTATISKEQNTVNISGKKQVIKDQGRHDACIVLRAVPVVEAMAALVTADLLLQMRSARL